MGSTSRELLSTGNVKPACASAGENWTAAKKASDKKDLGKLPPGFSPPQNALSAMNGMLRRLMALGELNLYNYSGGMPALSGSPEVNGKVNGTALGKAEKANGTPYKVTGIGRDLIQVDMLCWGTLDIMCGKIA